MRDGSPTMLRYGQQGVLFLQPGDSERKYHFKIGGFTFMETFSFGRLE